MGGMLYLHAAEFLAMALTARDRAAEERRLDPRSTPSDALVSVVMAATTEAFINELQAYYELEDLVDTRQPRELACADAVAKVEQSRGSTEERYLRASLALSDQMFDKGSQPFQDCSILMKVRNSLMHPKPLDTFDADAGVMSPPDFVRHFEKRKMTYERDGHASVSWLNYWRQRRLLSGPAEQRYKSFWP